MSSYSEYLSRKMQRTPKFVDTRPHRDAGHHTEILKRLAASGVQEQKTTTYSGNLVLNAPSTQVNSPIKGGHSVQDTSVYNAYTAGQAVAQGALAVNAKASQIQLTCYSSTVMPDYNDRLAADSQLAAVQAAKNTYQRGWNTASCCTVCGKPPTFKGGCACALTVAQQVGLPTSKSRPEVPS
jgi:hypothetical protein